MQLALDAISAVLLLLLPALGLAVIFGMMRVINMAHGELVMLGAYTMLTLQQRHVPFWIAVIIAPLVVGALGWLIERVLVRYTRGRPFDAILATWGLSLVLKQATVIVFGPASHSVAAPLNGTFAFAGIEYPAYRVLVMAIAAAAILAAFWAIHRTNAGLIARAVIARPQMAAALGIDTDRVYAASFAAGAALAGLAGALVAPLVSVDPEMGLGYLVPAFLAVLVGGAGSIAGTAFGGAAIGGAGSVLGAWWSPVLAQVGVFALAVLLIRLRPQGADQG